jgi:hypothetical protein
MVVYEPIEGDTNSTSTVMYVRATEVQDYKPVPVPVPVPVDTKPLTDAAYNDGLDVAEAAVHVVPRRS